MYYSEIANQLKKLNYSGKIPTLRDLHIDLLERGFMAAFITLYNLPIILMDKKYGINIKDLLDQTEMTKHLKYKLFKSKSYLKNLIIILNFLEARGCLDV